MIQTKHGDAFAELPLLSDDSVDLIITDPPYMSYKSRARSNTGDSIQGVFDDEHFVHLTRQCYRLLKPGRHLYIWTQSGEPYVQTFNAIRAANLTYNQTLVWAKPQHTKVGDFYATYAPQTELCIFAEKPGSERRKLNGNFHSNLFTEFQVSRASTTHPTQKPVSFIEYLILRSSNIGELVLDPFLGSGSTAFAARNNDRDFIGFEIVEAYIKQIEFKLGMIRQDVGSDQLA